MPDSCTAIYIHLVWATLNRMPLITADIEEALHACIVNECTRLKCQVVAIGGTADHIHILARLHTPVSVAALAKQMKGASSHLATHRLAPGRAFQWQNGYGAFSVSQNHVPRVAAYVHNQKDRHNRCNLWPQWEQSGDSPETANLSPTNDDPQP